MHKLDPIAVDKELEEHEDPWWRKYLVMILGVFLIFLMISFAFANPTVQNIIVSLFASDTIENGLVEQDITVQFTDESYDILLGLYFENEAHEFKACLMGYIDEEYFVTEVFVPEIFSQSFNQVISESCPEETLISLHSHPYRHCIASGQDLQNLERAKEVNPNAVIGIMCEPGRFNFYD